MIKNDYNYQIYLSTDYTYSQVTKIHLTAEKLIEYIKENRQELTKKG